MGIIFEDGSHQQEYTQRQQDDINNQYDTAKTSIERYPKDGVVSDVEGNNILPLPLMS
jgi:predicted heme/steroid binding protein